MTRFAPTLASIAMLIAIAAGAAPAPPLPATNPISWSGDARFFVAALDSIHPKPYREYRRAAWDSAAADLDKRLPTLRYCDAVAALSRLVGMLRDGHSRLDMLSLAGHGRPTLSMLPGPGFDAIYGIEAQVFADGLWIVRATPAHRDLLGSHITAIGGRPVGDAVKALAALIPSDNPMWGYYVLPAFLQTPGFVAAAGLSPAPTSPLQLTLSDPGGTSHQASLDPEPRDSTTRWAEADANLRALLPLTRSLPGPFSFADLNDSLETVFVRLREIGDQRGGETLAQFDKRLFAHVDSIGCRRLILDLRGNGGGNNYLNQPLVHGIIRRPRIDHTGGLFAVVDRGTFSAAVSLSCDLERETHAIFVGEPTGGAPNSPGDPTDVKLPKSGLIVRVSTVMWYGSDPRDPRAFIAPDLPAMPTYADWFAHRDPALAAIGGFRPPAVEDDTPPNEHWFSKKKIYAKVPEIAW